MAWISSALEIEPQIPHWPMARVHAPGAVLPQQSPTRPGGARIAFAEESRVREVAGENAAVDEQA